MWLLGYYTETPVIELPYKLTLCYVFVSMGLLIDFFAIWQFRQAKTTVNPLKPSKATSLVNAGIYQYTRNPMYLGNFMFLLVWLIWLGSPYGLLGLVFYVVYMNHFQIKPEEKALLVLFGDQYAAFCASVRRWI